MASVVTDRQQKHFSQSQYVVGHLQMVNDSSFILPLFSTPWAMGYPIETMEGIRMMDAGQAHDFGGL